MKIGSMKYKKGSMGCGSIIIALSLLALCVFCGFGCGGDTGGNDSKDGSPVDAVVVADGGHEDSSVDSWVDSSQPLDGDAPDDASLIHEDATPQDGEIEIDGSVECFDTVYMKTTGDDGLDGASPATAVASLGRVQEILKAEAPECEVDVRIEQGVYSGQTVIWDYYHPDYKVKFMPIDYHGGGIGSIDGRPVFDGLGASYLFRLNVSDGEPTNIEFIYLRFEHYQQYALHFAGNRNDFDNGWNGFNRVFGCYFYEIGNLASPGNPGYGALDLVNSIENVIRNNHFNKNENISSQAGMMHSVYLAHGSRWNEISNNQFHDVSGDPIRARDYSNFNDVSDNVFFDTGSVAFYSDWWCDMSQNPNCTKTGGECPSWENEFRSNELHCGYSGGSISTFHYFQGATYVPAWCDDHLSDGWARLYTSGNSKTCP